jgi:hypothetical protein
MTRAMFEVDIELLDNSSYGIFISDSFLDKKAKETVRELAHAAMQNDKANLTHISKILRSTSVQEGEELLEQAEREAQERAERLEQIRDEAMTKDRQEKIAFELNQLTQQQSNQLDPVVTNVNGFEMGVETEITEKPLKRRRALARNKQGVVMLKGEWSFSSIDQILIDELVFYIQQNNLKAD